MPFIDTNHQRAAILVLVLGVALLIALTPYATGLIGIPVLYAVFAPAHDWLAKPASPPLAPSLVRLLAHFLLVVPGGKSGEHTALLQSRLNLGLRLALEQKKRQPRGLHVGHR